MFTNINPVIPKTMITMREPKIIKYISQFTYPSYILSINIIGILETTFHMKENNI